MFFSPYLALSPNSVPNPRKKPFHFSVDILFGSLHGGANTQAENMMRLLTSAVSLVMETGSSQPAVITLENWQSAQLITRFIITLNGYYFLFYQFLSGRGKTMVKLIFEVHIQAFIDETKVIYKIIFSVNGKLKNNSTQKMFLFETEALNL